MPSVKKSVMFSESTVAYIHARSRDDNDVAWSKALNEGFKALAWVTKQALPKLTKEEWKMILDVYPAYGTEFLPPFHIASDLMHDRDELSIENLEKKEPEYAALVRKIHGFSQIEQFAIIDFVQRFLAADSRAVNLGGSKDWDEIYNNIVAL